MCSCDRCSCVNPDTTIKDDGSNDRLSHIFELQNTLNKSVGVSIEDVKLMSQEDKLKWVRKYLQALSMEISEVLVEVGAKWWKPFEFDLAKSREEAIDAFHFLVSILILLEISPEDLYKEYQTKNSKNHVRQDWVRRGENERLNLCKESSTV